jgi:3-oxoacyl-[acyl-carrier protein] reductase
VTAATPAAGPGSVSLEGRNALVTGGTRGIGEAVSLGLARAGARVTACYRSDEAAAEALARALKEIGGDHRVVRADVSRPDEVDRLVAETEAAFGHLHVVVHNAGVISHVPFAELPPEEWHRVLDTNLTAAYLLIRRALPILEDGASVIGIGSRAAVVGVPLRAHYAAAKSGLVGLFRSLAKELGPRVRCNVVAPGIIETDDPARMDPAAYAAMQERLAAYRQRTPLGRLGRPEDVANVVLFLAGDLSAYMTGATVDVDGGL